MNSDFRYLSHPVLWFIRNLVSMGQRAWVIGKLAENNNKE
jgi:hypothetical protein